LRKLDRKTLDLKVLKNAEVLGQIADEMEDKEEQIKHLND